jgi:hypothetical protein
MTGGLPLQQMNLSEAHDGGAQGLMHGTFYQSEQACILERAVSYILPTRRQARAAWHTSAWTESGLAPRRRAWKRGTREIQLTWQSLSQSGTRTVYSQKPTRKQLSAESAPSNAAQQPHLRPPSRIRTSNANKAPNSRTRLSLVCLVENYQKRDDTLYRPPSHGVTHAHGQREGFGASECR